MKPNRWIVSSLTAATALIAGACADSPIAPATAEVAVAVDGVSAVRKYPEGKEHAFTLRPDAPLTIRVGDHTVSFPAGAVCDRELSTYGPTEWDKPCVPSSVPVNIKVKASTTLLGFPRIDFSPKLRFVPGKDVILELRHPSAALLEMEVFYCPDNSGPKSGRCVNEGSWDAELKTKHNKPTGDLIRKIKHFSGYEVAAT